MGLQCPEDNLQDRFHITQHLVIPKPEHPKPGLVQRHVPSLILRSCLNVLTAIHLNNKLRSKANEVEDVISIRMLPSKLESIDLPSSQVAPEMLLGRGKAAA